MDGMDGSDGAPRDPGTPGDPGQPGLEGLACWDANGNRMCDGGEDQDGSGGCDVLDCQGAQGIQGDPGPSEDPGLAAQTCPPGEALIGIDASSQIICASFTQPVQTEKHVFVTSDTFNGNLGGLIGADAKCQAAADEPFSIVQPGTYFAWISTSSGSPSTRFTQSVLPYVLPDGTTIATDWDVLVEFTNLMAPIDQTATGAPCHGRHIYLDWHVPRRHAIPQPYGH